MSVALCMCVCALSILLRLAVCLSVCLSVLHYIFSTVQPAVDYLLLFHSRLSVPKCYVRNATPPNMLLFVWGTTWFSCFVTRGQNFSVF